MATTGNVFAGTGENNAGIGATAWTSPGSVTADDATDATCNAGASSQYLVARNFDFSSVPDNAVITGITVRAEASEHSAGTESLNAQLQDASGTLFGSSQAQTISGTTKAVYTYGAATDVWSATLTPAIVKDADFGVRFWFTTAHDVRVDFVTLAVDYELPPTPRTKTAAPQQTVARERVGFAVAFIAAALHIPAPPGTDTIGAAQYTVGTHQATLAERQPKPWVRGTPSALIPAPAVADSPLTRVVITIPQRSGDRAPQIWHALIPSDVIQGRLLSTVPQSTPAQQPTITRALIPQDIVGTDTIGPAHYMVGTHRPAQSQPALFKSLISAAAAADVQIARLVVAPPQRSADLQPSFSRALIPSDRSLTRIVLASPQREADRQPALSKALIPEPIVGADTIGSARYTVGTHRPTQISPTLFKALISAPPAEDRLFSRYYEADQPIIRQPQPYFARAKIDAPLLDVSYTKLITAAPQQVPGGSARIIRARIDDTALTKMLLVGGETLQQQQPVFAKSLIDALPISTPQPRMLQAGQWSWQQQQQQPQPTLFRSQIDPLAIYAPQPKTLLASLTVYQQLQPALFKAQIEPLPVFAPNSRTLYAYQQVLEQRPAQFFGRLIVESVADIPAITFVSTKPQREAYSTSQVWRAQIVETAVNARFVWVSPQTAVDGRAWVESPPTAYQVLGTDTAVGRFHFADQRFVPIQYAIASRIAVSWLEAGGVVTTFEAIGWDDVYFEPIGFDITKFDAR